MLLAAHPVAGVVLDRIETPLVKHDQQSASVHAPTGVSEIGVVPDLSLDDLIPADWMTLFALPIGPCSD
jgi:hypothetical protein